MAKNKEKSKVVIAMPCSDSVAMKAKTAHSVAANIICSDGAVIDFILKISCDIVANRTSLVKDALERKATHILFVDSDMQFPADTLTKLLAHNKEIVGVDYSRRQIPRSSISVPLDKISETELYKCSGIGTGLLLIKLSVFESIKDDPWFNFGRNSKGETVLGEDYWFSNVARDAGFDIWCDPILSKSVKHLGEYAY